MILKYISLFISILLVKSIECQNKNKLAAYVGIGYDVVVGNPISDRIDPGFRVPIFNLTYTQDQYTNDNFYKIPDGSNSLNKQSCSYSSKTNEYTGKNLFLK
jgi:hypothetical protein